MHALTAAEMLDVWETGQFRDIAAQALVVLAAATGAPAADLVAVSIPQRDALLFDVRRLAFGDELRARVACPACGEPLEFSTTVAAIAPASSSTTEVVAIGSGALRATVRPPTTADLFAIRNTTTVVAARDALLTRCLQSLDRDGHEIPFASLDVAEVAALADAASAQPALADVVLNLTCAACGSGWESTFDVAAFLWEEVRAFAARLLPEVHLIARTYGWSQGEILALSPSRRARYLELIEAGA